MQILHEGDLRISVADGTKVRKFDGDDHGLSHCMKAVDFLVELPDQYLFIEFKDPQDRNAPQREREAFIQRFLCGGIDLDLTQKYRDSFLYEWAAGRADKPIRYLVLIALDTLDDALLLARQEALKRVLPLAPQSVNWVRQIVSGCGVFNIASWNRTFPQYPVVRRSDPTAED